MRAITEGMERRLLLKGAPCVSPGLPAGLRRRLRGERGRLCRNRKHRARARWLAAALARAHTDWLERLLANQIKVGSGIGERSTSLSDFAHKR